MLDAQRQSKDFRPKFTNEERVMAYIKGTANRMFEIKTCYELIQGVQGANS